MDDCPDGDTEGPNKRRRLSRSVTPHAVEPLSDAALLYHYASAAHRHSTSHLQQAFIPTDILCTLNDDVDPLPLYPSQTVLYRHDPSAGQKAISLLILALDFLRVGLQLSLSPLERATFVIEYATIGIKVIEAKLAKELGVDIAKVASDVDTAVSGMLAACDSPQLEASKQLLQWLQTRIAFMQGRGKAARRLARQYIPKSSPAAAYRLYFLLLEWADATESLSVLQEIETRARRDNHTHLFPLLALVKTRILFVQRRWDTVPKALEDFAVAIGWREDSLTATGPPHVYIHYLILRCLWEGRIGNDAATRALLRRMYMFMDEGADQGVFDKDRARGGVVEIPIGDDLLYIQSTPPNIVFLITFLTTVTSRRDYIGPAGSCKSQLHARAMREFAHVTRKDDMWDLEFSPMHGLKHVMEMRLDIQRALCEIMLEEATGLVFRSDFVGAEKILDETLDRMRKYHLEGHLAPHLALIHAQYAQLLGYDQAAMRYYQAAENLLVPNSELGLMIQASMHGARGSFEAVKSDHERVSRINDLAHRCKRSSSVTLSLVGQLLLALTDDNLMMANLLRALVFAFTSSTHLTGSEERVQKQLETGLEIAGLLGGKDRGDGVGQPALGLWFAVKLKSVHNRNQDHAQLIISRSLVQRHLVRLNEITEFGSKRFGDMSRLAGMGDVQ